MRKVKGKNTTPEIKIRKILCELGFKWYRLHVDRLPGKPDVVFHKHKKVIFVHGCFWHGHTCRAGLNTPKTNLEYWEPKLHRNKIRDDKHQSQLKENGWNVLVIWECQTRNKFIASSILSEFMAS